MTPVRRMAGGIGTVHMLRSGVTANMATVTEPHGAGNVFTKHAGVMQFALHVIGQTAHISRKAEGVNAILKAGEAAVTLEGLALTGPRDADLPALPLIQVGSIVGGRGRDVELRGPNIVPDFASLYVDVRFTQGMTPESILADVRRALDARPGLRYEIEFPMDPARRCLRVVMMPFSVPVDGPLVRDLAASVEQLSGRRPQVGVVLPNGYSGNDTIPTPSMENSLLVGDFLFVSKFHYGSRTTTTPLHLPLTHQKIWFTNIPSYLEWIKLPQYRLPGFSHVKRNDVVVFNVPPRGLSEGISYPVDLKTNYIKRCVGVPGDILEIKNQQVYTNGEALENHPEMQYSYLVTSDGPINERNLTNLNLGPEDYTVYGRQEDGKFIYLMWLTTEKAAEIKSLNYIKSIEKEQKTEDDGLIPYSSYYDWSGESDKKYSSWSADNFGPLWIPKEGETIAINDSTLAYYGTTIKLYDHNKDVKIEGGKLFIDGKEVTEYTFKQNYYFMMGESIAFCAEKR